MWTMNISCWNWLYIIQHLLKIHYFLGGILENEKKNEMFCFERHASINTQIRWNPDNNLQYFDHIAVLPIALIPVLPAFAFGPTALSFNPCFLSILYFSLILSSIIMFGTDLHMSIYLMTHLTILPFSVLQVLILKYGPTMVGRKWKE